MPGASLCQNEPDHPVNRLSIIYTSNIYLMANMQFPEQDMEHGLKSLNKVNSCFNNLTYNVQLF